ncbi:MAG: hypothetical protein M3Y79_10470 [Pseudomonadota bacterium]|nr:hypothetical protein [Pseudomonadota bacterium]
MRRAERSLGAILFPGTVAALLSSLVIVACGRLERRRGLATHNGPAQWVHGTGAGYRRDVTLSHTLLGFLIHHASSCWWAFVQQRVFAKRAPGTPFSVHAAEAGAVALAANLVDYKLMPERLQPGFEKHISRKSLAAAYVAFGVGLALAGWWQSEREDRRWNTSP